MAAAVGFALAWTSLFTVATSEYAVVTDFGEPVQVITTPGLRTKAPYQSVARFDKRLFVHVPAAGGYLTREKTAVVASAAILWRIADPMKFFETVFDRVRAESRLSDILSGELVAAIGAASLDAFVTVKADTYRASEIIDQVAANCRRTAARDYGIEVVDVVLRRLDFPRRNRLSVFARMKSERTRISMKFRSEGEEEGLKIRANAEKEKAEIIAEASKAAQRLRGTGDAEAARIYGESLARGAQYYTFLRTLEAVRKSLSRRTTLVVPAESELFGLITDRNYFNNNDGRTND